MFDAAGPLRRSKIQRLLLLSESRLVALRQIKAAGSGEGASPVLRRLALLVLLNALWRAARQLAG